MMGLKAICTVFSGIQPSGKLHLGNYFGAIKSWVDCQDCVFTPGVDPADARRIYAIADLHALTSTRVPAASYETLALLLACGIDPQRSLVVRQSRIAEHTSLMWLFLCNTSVSRLEKMTQWKEKSGTVRGNAGLLTYPLLQAADICLYKATHVPVGLDQTQHLELAAEAARRLNSRLDCAFFPIPQPLASHHKIMSLANAGNKMSKSDPSPDSCIYLTDSPDDMQRKLAKAVTDTQEHASFDPALRPGLANLFRIMGLLEDQPPETIAARYPHSRANSSIKKDLSARLASYLAPIQKKYAEIVKDRLFLEGVFRGSETVAAECARETISALFNRIGL